MLEVISGDKRNFQRILFDRPVRLTDGEKTFESTLMDISLNGALIKRPENWDSAMQTDYQLVISLTDEDMQISMEVHAAHEQSDCIGFQCDNIDLDSISCLRRLVELNLGDNQLIDRELSALLN